jgi:hypothetical protein
MKVQCETCELWYDDAKRWTLCPHPDLEDWRARELIQADKAQREAEQVVSVSPRHFYPGSPEVNPESTPTLWQRHQIVIPCADMEQWDRISEKISEFCGHYKEIFVGVTEFRTNKLLGEVPFVRMHVGIKDGVPVKGSDPQTVASPQSIHGD